MPGSIYDGDYDLSKKWSDYMGADGVAKLWYESDLWDKKASRNAEQRANREDIDLLIEAVNSYDSSEFFNFADTYFSDQYYTYLALDVLWGTHHHDYFHNHKIYFDPYKGKFTPISWDIRFWRSDKNKDNSYYPLIEQISLNPQLEFKRDKELFRLLQIIDIEYINTLMSQEKEKFMDSFLEDNKRRKITINQKLFPWGETLNPPQLIVASEKDIDNIFSHYSNNLKTRLNYLKSMLDDAVVKYTIEKDHQNIKILFSVDGNSPVKIDSKNIKDAILYPGRRVVDGNALNLDLSGYGKTKVVTTPRFYTFSTPIADFDSSLLLGGVNAVTGKKVKFSKVESFDVKPSTPTELSRLSTSTDKIVKLEGTIEVDETLVYDKYTTVTIATGTTFVIDANRSIYFYGKVEAVGTEDHPIKFVAKDPKKPWGLVAVQGEAATGSRFEYCEFENGSIDTRNMIHYTSQFNIHDMGWFEVRHCKIGQNFLGDDAMHIAYAKGIVDSCEFIDARSDGLDIDISDVNITNNIFINSGNDGLDIMTTTMSASDNIFIDMGDKGISVGEWSEANITDTLFLRTVIGVEIKDKSKVNADNLIFVDTKSIAINLYNKNSRYDQGGSLEAKSIYLLGNREVKADKLSLYKIEKRVDNIIPNLEQYGWYKNLQNSTYRDLVDKIKVKYAQ
ncbi:MAG: right-handed parallel beta-helix repeat-containing protein [Campylobacterota bacterium]|nr:right-handed parallel beta-helix repeat-containing protein [Campylobacterota bacterium]